MTEAQEAAGKIFDAKVLRRLLQFAAPYTRKFYLLIVLTLLLGVLGPLRVWVINQTVDKQIANGDYVGLLWMCGVMVVLLLSNSVAQYSHTYLSGWLGQTIIRDIRVKLYAHILNLRLRFFDNTQVGRLITRNISDVETLSDVFTEGLAAMAGDILQLAFILGFMLYADWKLTVISLSMFPLLLVSTYVFKEKVKTSFNDVRLAVANLNTFVQEHITGMAIVQMFGSEGREYKKFNTINEGHRDANIRSVLYYSIYFPVAEVIGAAGTGLLIWWGTSEVLAEQVTLGKLIAFIMYITMFFRPIRQIADRFNTLQLGIVSTDRILKLIDNNDVTVNGGTLAPADVQGDIAFKHVSFAYANDNYVLKDISFSVGAGKTLAIVGATGAGKSSVINLLNRFYDINSGEITLDGKSINSYDLKFLRRNVGVVLQDVFLFSGTIADNISLGNTNITRRQMIHAAELVGAAEFIERLPGGLDFNVMERGATLSVGQRQLISFIRAMVFNPAILVLDEATSSVDTETEYMIQNAITKMMKGRTSIIIAHRLSTIQNADNIIVLDKGEIKEQGTHEELLNLSNGFYAQLHAMQFKEMV